MYVLLCETKFHLINIKTKIVVIVNLYRYLENIVISYYFLGIFRYSKLMRILDL